MLLGRDTFRRLCLARGILREEPEIPRSIEDIARLVQISSSHLPRQFEAVFGFTPHQFRIQ
jgi:AraC-like DNA-binding protein